MLNKLLQKLFQYTSLFCLFMALGNPAEAATQRYFTVSDTKSLAQIAAQIQSEASVNPTDIYHIIFSNYTNLGQFKLDAPTAVFDQIIFERDTTFESDAVIQVSSSTPLFDLKALTGKVVFKGLAFELTSPTAVLIAGADVSKPNSNLTMDSCFVYAENLSSTFLTWDAGELGNIDILRSFFVVKTGVKTTKAILSGGKVSLKNNLFNFLGAVNTTSYVQMNFISNTINLTQFNFTGNFSGGEQATYIINGNFVAFAPGTDAFTGPKILVIKISGFDEIRSYLTYNKMLSTGWQEFSTSVIKLFKTEVTDSLVDSVPGKTAGTLWNWDRPLDLTTGKNTGPAARKLTYNVYPSDSTFIDKSLLTDSMIVRFKSANFPRQFIPKFDAALSAPSSAIINPDLRFLKPSSGAIHFGPFQVNQIDVYTDPIYGHPILLAENGNTLIKQSYTANGGPTVARPSIFKNGTQTSRKFFLAFVGNTAKGDFVKPSSEVAAGDSVVFKKVDSAGYTYVLNEDFLPSDKSLRYLGKKMTFKTNAIITDSVIFGVKNNDTLQAYDPKKVYWFFPLAGNKLQPPREDLVKNGRISASVPSTNEIHAFLVEKLTIPADTARIEFTGGYIYSRSTKGYQIKIDSIAAESLSTAAKNQFGQMTKGIKFSEVGRGSEDSLVLNFTASANQILIEEKNGVVRVDTSTQIKNVKGVNTISKSLAIDDTAKIYFLGIKFNIVKDVVYNGVIEGLIELKNFKSATSGILKFINVSDDTLKTKSWLLHDSVFVNPDFLGGTQLLGPGIVATQAWTITLPIKNPSDPAKIEVWWSQGTAWKKLDSAVKLDLLTKTDSGKVLATIPGLPKEAEYVVIVERRPPPEKFVKDTITYALGKIEVKVTSVDTSTTKQTIDAYCLEYKTLELDGTFTIKDCGGVPVKIGPNPVNIIVSTTKPILYRIQYYSNGIPYGNYPFQILPGTSWDPATVLTTEVKTKTRKVWHLIGFPYNGFLKGSIAPPVGSKPDSGVGDSMAVMTIIKSPKDSLMLLKATEVDTTNILAGKAFLIGSTNTLEIKISVDSKFVPLQPSSLTVSPGWNFIANPFPVPLAVNKISVSKSATDTTSTLGKFWALKDTVTSTGAGGTATTYMWRIESGALKPFEGYLYFNSKPTATILVFDILSSSKQPKQSASSQLLKLNLEANWGAGSMYLSTQTKDENVGYFGTPNARLQLRVGGGDGYLYKTIMNSNNINETVRIYSAQKGVVKFYIPNPVLENSLENFHYNLIDLSSGIIYDEISARNLQVTEGDNNFQLLAGTESSINAALQHFLGSVPSTLSLSQNFPNPVRGLTKFELSLPILDSRQSSALLQISDAQGRIVQRKSLRDLHVGKQIISVDMQGQKSGIYFYQISAVVNGKLISKQNRMLVTP